MNDFGPLLFWSAIALIAYVFVGYPAVLTALGALRARPWRSESSEPNVSIVIAAHNESVFVVSKLKNLLALDYPVDRMEILIGSDGSTDGTVEQMQRVSDRRVRVFVFPNRRGKAAVLNSLIPKARGEMIVLTDVRQMFDSQVLRALIRSFVDQRVGAVSGELVTLRSNVTASYWEYEKFVRWRECIVDSSIGVTGAVYAIRKSLFQPIPDDTILDDVLIPMRIARKGYRVVCARDAHAYDTPFASDQEFKRKVRTLTGVFQLFARERWMVNPFVNRLWWQAVSHKALRLLVAPLQVTAFVMNLPLATHSLFYRFVLLAQMLFYSCAVAGWLLPDQRGKRTVLRFAYAFCFLSWATVHAFCRWIIHRQTVTWDRAVSSV